MMFKKRAFAMLTVLISSAIYFTSYKVNAQNCQVGWPIIIAPNKQDGDTEVSVWIESPGSISFDEFVIGGQSTSAKLTEQNDDVCNAGCAFVVRWKKIGSQFAQHTIMTDVNALVDIQWDYTNAIGAFLYLKIESSNQGKFVLQFNAWDSSAKELSWGETAYYINKPMDLTVFNDFTNILLLQDNIVYLIGNDPDRETIYNFWMLLDSTDNRLVAETWESELETDGGFFKGTPTRLYSQRFGYDTDHIIMLSSLTYPKGEVEFGGATILGAATNYMVVISRTMDSVGTPFTYQDKIYGVQQVSPALFYHYTHSHLAYLTNVSGFYKSDVFLHLAGIHTSKTKEIYLTTYIVKENHDLDHQYTRIFTADGTVEILGTSSRDTTDEDELWFTYVFYQETSISNRGKLMYTNMELSFEVVTYYFQDQQSAIDRNPMNIDLKHFRYDKDSSLYMWAGTANYVQGYGDEQSLTFSWMDTRRKFGYFTLWTTDEACYTVDDWEILSWGPRYQTYLNGLDEFVVKERYEFIAARPPNSQWNMGDWDDDNYDDLEREQKKIDEDGFWVNYRSWRYYDEEDREEQYLIYYIDGDDWVDRFNTRQTTEFKGKARDGSTAILALGLWGLGQVGLAVALWYAFLDHLVVDTYWGSWLVSFILLVGLQGGLFCVWPATYYGTSLSLDFAYGLAVASLTGPYGLYELSILFLVFTIWIYPTDTGYEGTGTFPATKDASGNKYVDWNGTPIYTVDEKIVWTVVAVVDYGLNAFFSIWFTPEVKAYRDLIKQVELEEAEAEEAKLNEESNIFNIGGEEVEFF